MIVISASEPNPVGNPDPFNTILVNKKPDDGLHIMVAGVAVAAGFGVAANAGAPKLKNTRTRSRMVIKT